MFAMSRAALCKGKEQSCCGEHLQLPENSQIDLKAEAALSDSSSQTSWLGFLSSTGHSAHSHTHRAGEL